MWFLGRYYAHPLAQDAGRREVTALARTASLDSLRGQVIEEVIKTKVFAAFRDNRLKAALKRANRILHQKISEYPDGTFSNLQRKLARREMRLAFQNLLTDNEFSRLVNEAMKPGKYHFERMLQFEVGISVFTPGVGVQKDTAAVLAFPDVIVEETGQPPTIVDWKVNRGNVGDNIRNRFQLLLYALAYSQVGNRPSIKEAMKVRMLEVQLLSGRVIRHTASEEVFEKFLGYVKKVSARMARTYRTAQYYEGLSSKELHWHKVPITSDPKVCEQCKFLDLCKRAPVVEQPALFV